MTKKLFVLVVVLFVGVPVFAQSVDTAWVMRYNGPINGNDEVSAIAVDDSGNVYVTGWTYEPGVYGDYLTVKYDSNGDTAWVRRYNGPSDDVDVGNAIAIDGSGNVYVTGRSGDYYLFSWYHYATIKYYPYGDTAWVRRYNCENTTSLHDAKAIAVDDYGNVYVTGESECGTGYDYATIKYYSNGDTAWVRRYNGPKTYWDYARAVAVDNFGNVYVTGESPGGATGSDYATIKYYSNGDTAWVRRYNGPENSIDGANALAIDDSGNAYVTGSSEGSGTSLDFATIKYLSNGDTAWVKRYNGPGNNDDVANAIAVDDSGNVYVTGRSGGGATGYDYATIKYNTNGDGAWVRRYNGPGNGGDYANAIAVDGSGNVYVTGSSEGSGTSWDFATIKYIPVQFLCGDVNDDSSMTVSDVVYLINYLFKGGSTPSPLVAGDVNNDGQITVSDVIYIINYLFKGGFPPCYF